MNIIEPYVEILEAPDYNKMLRFIELVGRTCYKSEDKITSGSAEKFVKGLIEKGHTAMIEHVTITVKFVCDRGVSHELVRHRLASFAQESTRFCNYVDSRFENSITVIKPCFWDETQEEFDLWFRSMKSAEAAYIRLIHAGASPQEARSVLPNSLKTEVVVTMNIREWRHFFNLRAIGTTGAPHPQMRQVARMAFDMFKENWPAFFSDLEVQHG